MADYYGLRAIAARMNSTPSTIRNWLASQSFLAYRRRKPGTGFTTWYTTDDLILRWQMSRCLSDVHTMRQEQAARRAAQRQEQDGSPASKVPA